MTETAKKRGIELAISVGLPLVGLLLLLGDHTGVFDHWRGLDKIEEVANRFDLSYATYASFPVYPEDAEWKPTIALIEKYSNVKWLAGRQPQRIARIQAQLSTHDQGGYEWTAPSTPVAVFFRRWPSNNGAGSPPQD